MATILDEIVENKKNELVYQKKLFSIHHLKNRPYYAEEPLSLKDALTKSRTGIIAEFKRKSPSKGVIHANIEPEDVIPFYIKYGCAAISCLADQDFFGGSVTDVRHVKSAMMETRCGFVPVLFKEFIIDPYQIYQARSTGADAVLLIAACLEKSQCLELADEAKYVGMETLLEIHSADELSYYDEKYIDVLGVNNRNLKIFKTDVEISKSMVKDLPENVVKISESGISKPETVAELKKLGYNGFLMGENFMKEENPGLALKNFIEEVEKCL